MINDIYIVLYDADGVRVIDDTRIKTVVRIPRYNCRGTITHSQLL